MARPRRRSVDTWKTKRWYKITSPAMFGEKEIGVTPSNKPEKLIGRTVNIDMYSLTGKRDLQYIKLKFKIKGLEGETAVTTPMGHEMQRAFVGRITRRVHTIVRAIQTVTTKDGYRVQVTAIAISRRKAHDSQKRAIRKIMFQKIEEAAKKPFEKFFMSIINGELGGEIYKEAKKIYPLNGVYFIKSEVLENPELKEAE